MDNACPHNSGRVQRCIKASRAEHLLHPDFSSDRAPSDFFLSGSIKGKPSNYNYESREDILNAITESFTGVDQGMLLSVLKSWVNRLKWVIKHEGKYYTWLRRDKRRVFKIGRENRKMRTDGSQ
jgi:hypothetical protein